MRLNELTEAVNITPRNLSVLKTGKAIRFSTLGAICETLGRQTGEILKTAQNWAFLCPEKQIKALLSFSPGLNLGGRTVMMGGSC
jgi:putative transcriptional regulator